MGDNTAWSQAAQLIGMGRQLIDPTFLEDYEEELVRLDVPRLELPSEPLDNLFADAREAFSVGDLSDRLARLDANKVRREANRQLTKSWRSARYESNALAALASLQAGLYHPDEVVRVSAAASLSRLSVPHPDGMIDVLEDGCFSETETVVALAADALAVVQPEHPLLDWLARESDDDDPEGTAHTSITIHGTWARWKRHGPPPARWVKEKWRRIRGRPSDPPLWWQPGGDFHNYARSTCAPDLYNEDDYFRWGGGHRKRQHRQGAQDLVAWCAVHKTSRLRDVYAHSHGGTVAFRAGNLGQEMTLLVLLSVPRFDDLTCLGTCVGRTISIRAHFDLVLVADLAPRLHPDPVRELNVRAWFSHGVSHDPDFWIANNLPNEITAQRALSCLP
jgi:hypothetical protein